MTTMQKHNKEKIVLILFMLLPTLAVSLNLDNDFWFLFNQGRYIVGKGFPHIEPFTIHADMTFVIQQWLFDVVVYYLYTFWGKAGVITLVFAISIVIEVLIYKFCMLISERKFYLSVLITTYTYLLFCTWFMVSRPQIFTYSFILIELLCLEKFARDKDWKKLILLPIVSLLQINVHASMWWLLFAFLLPYLLESFKIKWREINMAPLDKRPLFIVTVLMLLAGFIHPYGYKAILYVFKSYGNETINANIQEMAVPDIKSLIGIVFFMTFAFIGFCYATNRKGKSSFRYICLMLGTSVLALTSVKSIPYFLIGSMLPMASYLKNTADKLVFNDIHKKIKTVSVTGIFVIFIYIVSIYVLCEDYDRGKDYPTSQKAIDYLAEQNDVSEMKLYTDFFDGGYAQYKGLKTYIDARAEIFLESNNEKKDILDEYISLQKGDMHYKEFLDIYNFTHVLVNESDTLSVYLAKDSNYTVCYEDEHSKIYIPINKEIRK